MGFNAGARLRDNIEAIRTAVAQESGVAFMAEQLATLRKYSGFGGIRAIIYGDGSREEWVAQGAKQEDLTLYDDFQALYHILKYNLPETSYRLIVESLKESALTAFYTPGFIPDTIYKTLEKEGIKPRYLYEPSAGAGVFIDGALNNLPSLERITAVEKDLVTGMILQCVASSYPIPTNVQIKGLEETSDSENELHDLIISNIPFGNISVWDPVYPEKMYRSRIHTYFCFKGLDKIADGGLLVYLTTDAFLNSTMNEPARRYLFEKADLVSVHVLPENLMSEAGTHAPCHLLIVQKHTGKQELSADEQLLVQAFQAENEYGKYPMNKYLQEHPELFLGEISSGLNQYGKPELKVIQHGDIEGIAGPIQSILRQGLQERFNHQRFLQASKHIRIPPTKILSFSDMPVRSHSVSSVQLGLFDTTAPEDVDRALDYILDVDADVVKKESARILGIIRVADRPDHEALVFLSAKHKRRDYYVYAIRSNVGPLSFSVNWQNAQHFALELQHINQELKQYDHGYVFDGDRNLGEAFSFEKIGRQPYNELLPYYREGTLVLLKGHVGLLEEYNEERTSAYFEPITIRGNQPGFFPAYIALRDQYHSLLSSPEDELLRNRLREGYLQFVQEYGQLNRRDNQQMIRFDKGQGLLMLSSLERREGERFVMSDILSHRLSAGPVRPKSATVQEALAYCLNDRRVPDIDFISEISGKDETEVIAGLKGQLFLNPSTNQWETADQYLSGNVVEKLKLAKNSAADHPENQYYSDSLKAIQDVQPERVPFELLDFNFGERWIPNSLYAEYISALLETETTVRYMDSSDAFKVSYRSKNTKTDKEYAVVPKAGHTMYAHTIIEHALENTSPYFTYEVHQGDRTFRRPDNDAIQLAHEKVERIRSGFITWLAEQPDTVKKELEENYNTIYNCSRLRVFDGSHQSFPGLDMKGMGIPDLYSSQKDAVWRLVQCRGGLIDHEVGLGKTMIMVVAAHEMKRLGLCQKPLLLTLNANMQEIADTYRRGYPNDRVLIPNDKDFTPKNRQRLFHEMKNNEWDAVIITHDQFLKIKPSAEVQQQILSEELANVQADLDAMKYEGADISKKVLKGLHVRKTNLTNNLKAVQAAMDSRRDNDVDFNNIGFDHLFVDEFHKFKNLMFSTRHTRVSGLGNMEGSQKSLNMLYAMRHLQNKFQSDLCSTVLTGTPISNSLTELYLLFKYLRPNELARQRIQNFDSWAAVFAKKTTDFEFTVTGEIVAKERFRHFIKVPELALAYNEIADYKTAAHINLDRPKLVQQLVNLKPSPEQEVFIQKLIDFARTGDYGLIGRNQLGSEQDKGRMLIATHMAKNMAVDLRLISEAYEDHPDNKVNSCARNAYSIYKHSTEYKGVQLIFCDIGTPGTQGFGLYDAMKTALVNLGVPPSEITYIHEWKRTQRGRLYKLLNKGEIRFLLGSTDKAGTGLNVQERVVAIHHLDVPWRPIDLQQRDGRGARPGNKVVRDHYDNIMNSFIYATEKSLDGYKFNLLRIKQLFTTQLKKNELHVRRLDEGGFDEQAGMNFSEYVAILSGDTSLLEKSKLDRKVAHLENLRAAHYRETTRYRWEKEGLQHKLDTNQSVLAQLSADEKVFRENLILDKKGVKVNAITIDGVDKLGSVELAGYLLRLHKSHNSESCENPKRIGSQYGFDLYIQEKADTSIRNGNVEHIKYNYYYAQREGSDIKYTSMDGQPSKDNLPDTARIFLNGINKVSGLVQRYETEGENLSVRIEQLGALADKPFEKEDELKALKTELDTLSRKIQTSLQQKISDEQETSPIVTMRPRIEDVDIDEVKIHALVALAQTVGSEVRPRKSISI